MILISIRFRTLVLSVAMVALGGVVGCEGQSSSPPPPPGGAPPPAVAPTEGPKATKGAPISNAAQDSARPGGKAP
jgi:hypothetical protein